MASAHEIIGEEWAERAGEMADWAMEMLVMRKDVWGQYSVLTPAERRREGKSYKAMTLPRKEMRGDDMVTIDKLTRHFSSRHHRKPQIIGLHAKSKETTSRWFGIDIDMHDCTKADAEDHGRRNLNCALKWWKDLQIKGYDPMLFNTNLQGGYHIWVLFDKPAPTVDIYAMVKGIVETWEQNGLEEEPETFPKKVKEGSLGSWFRLPGLHHTLYHYSSLWSGDDWLENPWLTGHNCIDVMLETRGGPPPPRIDKDDPAMAELLTRGRMSKISIAAKERKFKRTGKAKVCIDLDGVLALRVRSGKKTDIGPPIDGAVEFTREIDDYATIIILTSRMAGLEGKARETMRGKIEDWLDKHRISYDHVHDGAGKPPAHAYIDDKGVSCRPEYEGAKAFKTALGLVENLCE
ncbi:MAG: hypothetical protein V3U82_09120 [Robiginitomaculum sp.]